jgi:hypothetical protein
MQFPCYRRQGRIVNRNINNGSYSFFRERIANLAVPLTTGYRYMKKIVLASMAIVLYLGAFSQVIKMTSRAKHHTYSHRGPFVAKPTGHKTARLAETSSFNNAASKPGNKKKPA